MGLKGLFQDKEGKLIDIIDIITGKNQDKKEYIQAMATAHAIDLIAKTIAKTELQVYAKDKKDGKIKETINDVYYRLNLKPNNFENGTSFMYKLACKLLLEQEALVILEGKEKIPYLYLADSFDMTEKVLYPKKYKNITISDNRKNSFNMQKEYDEESVLYFSFFNPQIKEATETFKKEIGTILNVTSKSYIRKNIDKWRMKYPGKQPKMIDPETKEEISNEKYKNKIADGLLTEDEAIILLSEQFNLENLNKDRKQDFSDFEKVNDLIKKEIAMIFNIPQDIFFGTKTEKSTATNDFITFAVDPVLENIEDGLNIGLIGMKDYIRGERIMSNRFNMKHVDILDASTSIDKLTGARFSRNEINKLLRLPQIDEAWANEHDVTKNYGRVGGEKEDGE